MGFYLLRTLFVCNYVYHHRHPWLTTAPKLVFSLQYSQPLMFLHLQSGVQQDGVTLSYPVKEVSSEVKNPRRPLTLETHPSRASAFSCALPSSPPRPIKGKKTQSSSILFSGIVCR
ncbi:hypothetical protein Peur_012154 [Populus x canadensis]